MVITKKTFKIDIVSVQQEIFSGQAEQLIVMGKMGELGILPGHTPLLTFLKPGEVRVFNENHEEVFYVSGGILEVQPFIVTILADVIVRAKDLDEVAAIEVQKRAEKTLKDRKVDLDYYAAVAELAQAMAKIRVIRRIKGKH